jgi:mannan endo-1,4-beta-mannosidase
MQYTLLQECCMKSTAPKKLIIDGTYGTYGINKTHFTLSDIEIFSDHFYSQNVAKLHNDIASVGPANRVYPAGVYD